MTRRAPHASFPTQKRPARARPVAGAAWRLAPPPVRLARPTDPPTGSRPAIVPVLSRQARPLAAPPASRRRRGGRRAPGRGRARPGAARVVTSKWFHRALALLVLIVLLPRAALDSATLVLPGGQISGWSARTDARCLLCQLAPAGVGGGAQTPARYAALLAGRLTLDQQLGQLLIVQFAGRDATPDALQMVNAQGVGGVLSFAANIGAGDQVRGMTGALQRAAPIPPLLAIDQEGGYVNRFRALVGPLPGAGDLTSVQQARARGQQDAGTLHDYGYNLDLAPVVDVGTSNPQLYDRTFGDDPARVARMAGAYLAGLQQSGYVTATLKHFPGLGATNTDPHIGLPTLGRSRADLERLDLAPYRALLAKQDVRAIMVSHELIPSVDAQYPTSLSPAVIDGLLRGELGYQGVVITDSLVMGALSDHWSVPRAAVLAIAAGADMAIGAQSPQMVTQIEGALKGALASGQLTRERIQASVTRILALKIAMGLIPMPAGAATSAPTGAPTGGHAAPRAVPAPPAAAPRRARLAHPRAAMLPFLW